MIEYKSIAPFIQKPVNWFVELNLHSKSIDWFLYNANTDRVLTQ